MSSNEIAAFPLETRMRWLAEMNCWRRPDDFPIPLPDIEDDRVKFADPQWKAAWDALNSTLTEAEQSLGWWINALKETPAEWRAWWVNERHRSAAQADALLAALSP